MNGKESAIECLVKMAEEKDEFFHLEDGYVYWGPFGYGAVSAWMLRALADELDKRNKEWDTIVQNDSRIG